MWCCINCRAKITEIQDLTYGVIPKLLPCEAIKEQLTKPTKQTEKQHAMVLNSIPTDWLQILRLRSHGNDIVLLSYRSDFWNEKVDCSHGSGPLSYQFWDLFTRVRYRIVPKHFAPKQAKENLICQQISNTAE